MSLFDDMDGKRFPGDDPPTSPSSPLEPTVLSVSALVAEVKGLLGDAYPEVWVRGEIAGLKIASSGHMYFALKDASAMLSCAWFKFRQRGLRFAPRDGMEVEARCRFDLYAPRGSLQLMIEELRPAGIGALLLAFEERKQKLAAEGLFDAARKRPLPMHPRTIGLVTSPTGAAIHDLLVGLRRRWPGRRIVLAPVLVQGPGAAPQIAAAIERMNRLGGVDVMIVGRGGGSLEDLWAFNEEDVVRAIAASRIPIVSAVGHEVDVTLADLAADVRAATPTAAAELVTTPTRAEVRRDVRDLSARAADAAQFAVSERRDRLDRARARYGFRRADDLVAALAQTVDGLADRLARVAAELLARARGDVRALAGRVHPGRLVERVAALVHRRRTLEQRLALAQQAAFAVRTQRARTARARLVALSPRAVLARGYALVTRTDGAVVRAAADLAPDATVGLEFARGRATARILTLAPSTEES